MLAQLTLWGYAINMATATAKPKPSLFLNQPQMRRVVYALLPLLASAVYFFGWRAFAVVSVTYVAGFITEFITARSRKTPKGAPGKLSQALFVSCMLLGLSLPASVPFYVPVVAIVVGILFGKEVFGGFGRNFVNPAILGRAFVYICFPIQMTSMFVPAFTGVPGGFAHWSFETAHAAQIALPDHLAAEGKTAADAISQASPLWVMRDVGEAAFEESSSLGQLLLGNIGGTFTQDGQTRILTAGSMGEGCALLILLAAVYLLWTKTANWRLMIPGLIGFATANVLLRNVLGLTGLGGVPPLPFGMLAGTSLFVLVFMVTDPVSAPKQKKAQLAYGFLIGLSMVFFRWRGVFVAAASFAVLFGNILAPWLDIAEETWKEKRSKQKEQL